MIIGLVGYARAGKSTVAKMMYDKDRDFHTKSFATALKLNTENLIKNTCGKILDLRFNEQDKLDNRNLLVAYGEAVRRYDPKHWIWELAQDINYWEFHQPQLNHVIDDVRYLNEIEWIKSRNGIVVYISRPGIKPANSIEENSIAEILSSGLIDGFIDNNGSLDELRVKAEKLMLEARDFYKGGKTTDGYTYAR